MEFTEYENKLKAYKPDPCLNTVSLINNSLSKKREIFIGMKFMNIYEYLEHLKYSDFRVLDIHSLLKWNHNRNFLLNIITNHIYSKFSKNNCHAKQESL